MITEQINRSYFDFLSSRSDGCWGWGWGSMMVYLSALCTFEVGSDAGIISWCLPHELVQEVWRWQLWPCPARGLYLLLTGAESDIVQARGEKHQQTERKENIWETVEETVYDQELALRKKWVSSRMRTQRLSPSQSDSKKYPAAETEMRVTERLPTVWNESLPAPHHVWDSLQVLQRIKHTQR